MFDTAIFTNRDSIGFLEKMNQFRWYINHDGKIGIQMSAVRKAVEACETKRHREAGEMIAAMLFAAMTMQQTNFAKSVRLLSLMVAQGPKLFQPTHELCEYFESVDVNLPIADYEQSYPVVVIRLPQSYMKARNINFPFVGCLFEREQRHLTTLSENIFSMRSFVTTITPKGATIEAALSDARLGDAPMEWNADLEAIRLAERVAINSNLFLVDRGFRVQHMLDTPHRERRARRGLLLGERLLPPRELVLTQDVLVTTGKPVESDGAVLLARGISHHKRTHYRRGHWRMQRYGAGRTCRRRIFIPPMLINPQFDSALPAERQVIYRSSPNSGEV